MAEQSLSHKTLKNSAYTFIGYTVPILFSIFITPVIVHKLGVADYGIYILVNTIAAFMALLDLGLSTALIKYISQYNAEGNSDGVQKLISSANLLYIGIGALGMVIYLVLGKFFLSLFHIASQNQPHIFTVFLLGGILFFFTSISTLYAGVPAALQRFDVITKINLSQLFLFNVGVLVAVLLGFKLKAILIINIFTILIALVALRHNFKKLLPHIKLNFDWDKPSMATAYRFGILAAVSNFASNSLIQLDRFIVPIFSGTSSLSYYSLPGNVAQKTYGITGSLVGVLFPVTSAITGEKKAVQIQSIYRKAIRNISLLAAACTSAIIAFAYQILFYWLGKDFADKGAAILIILAVTYFLLALLGTLNNFLLGLNKVKFLTFVSVSLAVLNIILLLLLVPRWGIVGAAWAYLGAVLPVPLIFYWVEKKYLGLADMGRYYGVLYSKILTVTVLYFLLMHYLVQRLVVNLASLIVVGPLAVLVYLGIYVALGFMEKEDRNLFMAFWQKIRSRLLLGNKQDL